MGGSRSARREPKHAREEHAHFTQKGPSPIQESNWDLSCSEAHALPAGPPFITCNHLECHRVNVTGGAAESSGCAPKPDLMSQPLKETYHADA